MSQEREFPQEVSGMNKMLGVPNTKAKPFFADASEAIRRCKEDPLCVGVSAQRMFYVGKKGEHYSAIGGRAGEEYSFVKPR